MSNYAIKQVVDVGEQFAGTAPDGTPTEAYGVQTYAWGTEAGLWTLPNAVAPFRPYEVVGIQARLVGAGTWAITIEDGSISLPLLSGTTETVLRYAPDPGTVILLPNQTIKMVNDTNAPAGGVWTTVIFGQAMFGEK